MANKCQVAFTAHGMGANRNLPPRFGQTSGQVPISSLGLPCRASPDPAIVFERTWRVPPVQAGVSVCNFVIGRASVSRARKFTAVLAIVALACFGSLVVACGASSTAQSDPEYGATVQALLPTLEATHAAVAQNATTTPPTQPSTSQTDTPASVANPPSPTYTPRPLPTYTPRPTPPPAEASDRSRATPFHAMTLDGSELNLADTYGTPTLLAFWAPW